MICASTLTQTITVNDITAHVIEELVGGASHLFAVCAVNSVGAGSHSAISSPVTVASSHEQESEGVNDIIRLKMRSFEQDYEKGEEILRYTSHTLHTPTHLKLTYNSHRGTYSTVLRCRERKTDRVYVAKHMTAMSTDEREKALVEYDIHHTLTHPRLVAMEDAFFSDAHITLVME